MNLIHSVIDFEEEYLSPHHKHPTLKPQEYQSTLETWRVLNPNQRQSELTFYKGLHHLVSIQILLRSSGFSYELVVVTAMILRWFKASPRTITALESRTWHPKKFRCYSEKKEKPFLYLQIIFNSSVLQITT